MAIDTKSAPVKRRRLLWGGSDDKSSPKDAENIMIGKEAANRMSDLPAPFTYESLYSSYAQEWKESHQSTPLYAEVLGLTGGQIGRQTALVACTSLGKVMLWAPNTTDDSTETVLSSAPVQQWNVSKLPLKSLQFVPGAAGGESAWILAGGEEGVWSIALDSAKDTGSAVQRWTCADSLNVKQVLVDTESDRVFILDESGQVHVFRLSEKKRLQTLDIGRCCATTMALTPDPALLEQDESDNDDNKVTVSRSTALLIGTSESHLLIWTPSGATLETIHLYSSPDQAAKSSSSVGSTTSMIPFEISLTAIGCSNDQWWTIAGVAKRHHKSRNPPSLSATGSNSSSILATIHGPTRSCVSVKECRESISSLMVPNRTCMAGALYTVANEGALSVWESPYQLERSHRIWTSPPSGKAMAAISMGDNKTLIVLAGVGPYIDVIQDHCRIQTLNVQVTC